jgi:hypothetical protein
MRGDQISPVSTFQSQTMFPICFPLSSNSVCHRDLLEVQRDGVFSESSCAPTAVDARHHHERAVQPWLFQFLLACYNLLFALLALLIIGDYYPGLLCEMWSPERG